MNLREWKYMKTSFTGVSHTTLNPRGPGVVRIHLVPPKHPMREPSVVILNGIDTYLAANEKVKANAELVSKVVAAFGKGCLTVLNMPEDCPECRRAKAVYATRSMKFRGGKFVAP